MNKYLTLVLALTVVSAPAFASRARLESLGEGENGSYYIDDARNIFLNPAEIVHYKKKLWLETGTEPGYTYGAAGTGGVTGGNNTSDLSVAANRAQGGFSNTFGDFTYGVYMNQASQKTLQNVAIANAITGGTNTFIAPDSNIELFFAGEGAVNWGVSAWWAGNDSVATAGNDRTAKQIGARVGIEAGALQAFATVGIVSKSYANDATGSTLDGKVGVDGGVTYKMNDATLFAKFLDVGSDVNNVGVANTNTAQIRDMSYGLGAGWKKEMTKSTNLFARLEGDYEKAGVNTTTVGINSGTVNTWNLPAAVGAEAQALSWLAIRGSIQESLIGEQTGNTPGTGAQVKNSLGGTTTVSLGLGLTFGDVQIDGLVATNGLNNPNNSATGGNTPGFGTAPQSSGSFGFGDGMLTRVSLTYNF
jgi:hypothetical protein